MDVKQFVDELISALANSEHFSQVIWHVEGPVVQGRANAQDSSVHFLRFYFNERTGTIAFALIEDARRSWGIDFDNRRGWHLHPADDPTAHVPTEPLSVKEIIDRLHVHLNTRL